MKHLHLILVISCSLLFTCQTDDTEVDIEQQATDIQETSRIDINRQQLLAPINDLEEKLQWASYIAAKVYIENRAARNEFHAAKKGNTVSLQELLGPSNSDSAFYKVFKNELIDLFRIQERNDDDEDDDGEEDEPLGDILICCTLPPPPPGDAAGRFIDYIVSENCIEFFLPNLHLIRNPSKVGSVTSTAHPLTNADSNDGYWRYATPTIYPDGFYGTARKIKVDKKFVAEEQTLVIAARPVRNPRDPNCNYDIYDVIDFTKFLDILE